MMREELVGHCGVDSGQVWIGDPCYVMEDMFGGGDEPTGGMYDECCRVTLSKEAAGEAALGVSSATNYGDGNYPVYVTYDGGGRPTSLRIVFVEERDPNVCDYCECDTCVNGRCPCECDCNCPVEDEEEEDTQ
jgi:hypothetical protein